MAPISTCTSTSTGVLPSSSLRAPTGPTSPAVVTLSSYTFTGLENGKRLLQISDKRGVVTGQAVVDRLNCLEWRIHVTPTDPSIPALTDFEADLVPNKSRQVKLSWNDPGDSSLTYRIHLS